jgi:hypothetical protein
VCIDEGVVWVMCAQWEGRTGMRLVVLMMDDGFRYAGVYMALHS